MSEPLDVRLVIQISYSDLERIKNHQHGERMNNKSEAARAIMEAGFAALGLSSGPAPAPIDDRPAPTIPTPDQCGRPVMGEIILPWLRKQGRGAYTLDEVLRGAFNEDINTHAVGRDRVVINLFKTIGWRSLSNRSTGKAGRSFVRPD